MKKITVLVITVTLFTALFPAVSFAHPPKAPEITWAADTHTLTVSAPHFVSNPAKHYVLGLVVLNSKGEQLLTKQYTKQASEKTFSDSVQINSLKNGDTVKVRLICNIMGTAEKEFKLP